jgi:DNA (cytosine-5)-methyltransferase 1
MKNDLTHLDLFSGIGGFALAAKRAGFRTIGFSEIEAYACKILALHFPDVPNLGDIRRLESFSGISRPAVLTGGYPCQPFSFAGKRGGSNDDRHLWPAMFAIIKIVRPSWIICENVFGHVSMGLDSVLSDLESVGYSAQSFIIPACAVDARHRRDRVWIVAHSDLIETRGPEAGRETRRGLAECDAGELSQQTVSDTMRDGTGKGYGEIPSETEIAAQRTGGGISPESCDSGKDVADTAWIQQGREEQRPIGERIGQGGQSIDISNPNSIGRNERGELRDGKSDIEQGGPTMADAVNAGTQKRDASGEPAQPGQHSGSVNADWCEWLPESGFCRVADGIPDRVDRLKGLGNAIVPQVVEKFFHWIRQIETGEIK